MLVPPNCCCRSNLAVSQKIRHARLAEAAARALADDGAVLVRWLREDILTVAGRHRRQTWLFLW